MINVTILKYASLKLHYIFHCMKTAKRCGCTKRPKYIAGVHGKSKVISMTKVYMSLPLFDSGDEV